jgi:aryl-alcohol dehydrogenase-like predicted oxidoreductase
VLAQGALTGKYRADGRRAAGRDFSVRADFYRPHEYLDERGLTVLRTLEDIAEANHLPVAAVTLAWSVAQPGVAAAVASARTPCQLHQLMAMTGVRLTADELSLLDAASPS